VKGVIGAYAVYQNGIYKVVVECRSEDGFALLRRKLRLIGVFITVEKGFR